MFNGRGLAYMIRASDDWGGGTPYIREGRERDYIGKGFKHTCLKLGACVSGKRSKILNKVNRYTLKTNTVNYKMVLEKQIRTVMRPKVEHTCIYI